MNAPESLRPADWPERETALDPARSFCVQAPAGSGKTELLTQRILGLLAVCERPEEILAITFTRKAAAEMRHRLIKSLHGARALDEAGLAALPAHARRTAGLALAALARDREQGWRLLDDTNRLRITTIDSFNAWLTAQLPVIAGFGGQPEVSDDMGALYRESVAETLALLESDDPLSDAVATLLGHLDNNLASVQQLLCGLLTKRDQWLAHVMTIRSDPAGVRAALEANLRALIEERLGRLGRLLAPFEERLMPLLAYAADNRAEAGDSRLADLGFGTRLPGREAECLPQWRGLCGLLLTTQGAPRKTVTVNEGFPAPKGKNSPAARMKTDMKALCAELADAEQTLEALQGLACLPEPHYSDPQWRVLEALTALLPRLVAQLHLAMARHGKVDFVEVSRAALDALGDDEQPTDLALRLDYRIRHILVDEFQDTSHLQIDLLARLGHGWQGDGRSLFIVGDGMQSCYGFRDADVGLFLKARDQGIGGMRMEPLQLKVNFRSERAVVDWVNRVFSGAFPAADDIGRGAVRYSASEAFNRRHEDAGVETLLLACDKDAALSPGAAARAEAREVLRLVREISERDPQGHIAILVRSRGHLADILPLLQDAGIPWNANDIDPLAVYPPVRDLLSLCRALLNLADTSAWLALLRTPFCGLALADIHHIAQHAREQACSLWQALRDGGSIDALSDDAQGRLRRLLPPLERARRLRGRVPLRDCLLATWTALGGPACLSASAQLPVIERFFRLLEEEEAGGDLNDIHALEDKLSAIHANGSQDSRIRLSIMTIHKAKGLEFDYVILPGLGKRPRADDKPLLLWKNQQIGDGERLLLSLLGRKGEDEDSVYRYLRSEAQLKSAMESTRLLYIGVTRAVRKAWLLGQVSYAAGKEDKPESNSLLATIWDRLCALDGEVPVQRLEISEDSGQLEADDNVAPPLLSRRLPASWQHPRLQAPEVAEPEPAVEPPEPRHHHLRERRLGEILHACLQDAAELGEDPAAPAFITAREAMWRLRLRPLGIDIEEALAAVREQLTRCAAHPRLRWLLDPSHQDSACELSLSEYTDDYGRGEYIVDRSFVDAEGIRWIIDYKSSQPANGQSLEDFLVEQEARYRPQLENYARLFRAMEQRPQRLALFFTAVPHLHELGLGD